MTTPQLTRAQQFLNLGRHQEAAAILGRHLASEPDDPIALTLMSIAMLELDRLEEASDHVGRAIAADPDDGYPRYVESMVWFERGRFDEAERAALDCIRLDPDEATGFGALARVHLQRKRWKAALGTANEGLRVDPEDVNCANARAMALGRIGDHKSAAATLEGQLGRDPDDAFTHANLGWTRLRERDYAAAESHFRESLRLDPSSEWAREGAVESLRARHWFYRPVLRWFLWMDNLEARWQFAILVGGWFGYRVVLSQLDSANPLAPLLWLLVAAYFLFVIATWFATPIANGLLTLNPLGRLALLPRERRQALTICGLLGSALASAVTGWALGLPLLITVGVAAGLFCLPLWMLFQTTVPRARTGMLAYTCVLLVLGSTVVVLSHDSEAMRQELSPTIEAAKAIVADRDELEARRKKATAAGGTVDPESMQQLRDEIEEFKQRNAAFEKRLESESFEERAQRLKERRKLESSLWTAYAVLAFFVSQFVAAGLVTWASRR